MGRYSTVQTYSDQNTKVVAASAISSKNEQIEDKAKKRLVVEKVENVMGSTAGAGSGEFDVYRAARRRELTRLDAIEAQQKAEEEARTFAEKVAKNKAEADSRTAKNAEKRNKKKMKKLELKRKYEEVSSTEKQNEKDGSDVDNAKTEEVKGDDSKGSTPK